MPELPDRILSRILKTSTCWLWTGRLQRNGYSVAKWKRADGKWGSARVHRLMYEAYVGPIPEGLEIDHECHLRDNACPGGAACRHRRCVNPSHLRAVTHKENCEDRTPRPLLTACKRAGHPYTEDNIYWHNNGKRRVRSCIACARERYRAESEALGRKPRSVNTGDT